MNIVNRREDSEILLSQILRNKNKSGAGSYQSVKTAFTLRVSVCQSDNLDSGLQPH